jgi:hypothetical protein
VQEIYEAINIDVNAVIDYVLTNKTYENIYLVGKSIGTIAMISILKRESFKLANAIWLTPLIQRDDVFDAMVTSKNRSLCIIGDNDPCYKEERYAKVANNPYMKTKLIPKVNHSLEYSDNTIESINVLRSVIKEIEQF